MAGYSYAEDKTRDFPRARRCKMRSLQEFRGRFRRPELMFLARGPCRSTYPRNREEFHKRLGGCGSSSASAIPWKRRRARRKRKKQGKRSISQPLARENAAIRGSHVRRNVHTRESDDGGDSGGARCRSAPLRVQGHAECKGYR